MSSRMKVCMITIGTMGDVVPFVALGKALAAAGHSVTLCASRRFGDHVKGHGLAFGQLDDRPVALLDSDLRRSLFDRQCGAYERARASVRMWKQVKPLVPIMLSESWDAVQAVDPDVILYHPTTLGGHHFAELLGIPPMLAAPWPQLLASGRYPMPGFPNLGRTWNRWTHRILLKMVQLGLGPYLREWRREHHLAPQPSGVGLLETTAGNHVPALLGFSPHVFSRQADWPPDAHVTGYWFLDQRQTWQPPRELVRFLDAGDPPVYVGFGSMAGLRPQPLTSIIVEALRRAGVRGIIAKGWGGLEADDLPDTILGINEVPHDWLFPRMAAVVHHGGAGTTGAGLRAGRPTVVCPFYADQPFWGDRVYRLGVGSHPIRQRQLTAENLAASIREVTQSDAIQQNAAALGEAIRAEDGLARAATLIEQTVREWR